MRIRSTILALITAVLGLSSVMPYAASAKKPDITDTTPVVVAEDKTLEVDCQFWVGSEDNLDPCLAGSVIFTRETLYSEVRERGITYFDVLTGDPKKDDKITDNLAFRARKDMAPSMLGTMATCTPVSGRRMGGRYHIKPGDTTSPRIYYEVQYDVSATCNVSLVSDRTKSDGARYTWVKSCTGGQALCTDEGIQFDGAWTAFKWKLDTVIGAQYTHISYIDFLTAKPYGWTFFVN